MKIYTDKELKKFYATSYEVIDFKFEYPQYNEAVRFGIITDMTEPELENKYGDDLNHYRPYIILNSDFGIERYKYRRNEKKFQMRSERTESIFGFDEKTEYCHPDIPTPDFSFSIEFRDLIEKAVNLLTEKQKRRSKMYYTGMKIEEIADREGCSIKAVKQSLDASKEKIKIFINQNM